MIVVTRLDKQLMYLNPDHIISIEETPDTVITLFNGNRYIVIDRASMIIGRVIAFRAVISRRASLPAARRYLRRQLDPRLSRFKNQPEYVPVPPDGEHNHTLFHSLDY